MGVLKVNAIRKFYVAHKELIYFSILLLVFIFLRFFELPQRLQVGWDQADSAWAVKSIVYDNPFRLEGVPIKGNASMFMGPLYYYLITPIYFLAGMDMIASGIYAGLIAVCSFAVFYVITKKLFDKGVALLASLLYVFSFNIISADRVQAAYVLIPILSYAAFYCLYKALTHRERYIIYFMAIVGFGFHVHFTSLFYLFFFVLALPFFRYSKKMMYSSAIGVGVFLMFLSPMIYALFFMKQGGSNGIIGYLQQSYHGIHIRRILQLTKDAFISFETILQKMLKPLVFVIVPLFGAVYYKSVKKKNARSAVVMLYLISIWIIVPWIMFATYNGELTDYYFSLPRNIGIAMIGYLLWFLLNRRSMISKIAVYAAMTLFIAINVNDFYNAYPGNYQGVKNEAKTAFMEKRKVQFKDRDPFYYMYYVNSQLMNK